MANSSQGSKNSNIWDSLLSFLASLKLAVIVILSLAISCGTATFLESLYDADTARYWVYNSFWFRMILIVLCINLIAVMVDRWPWKMKHIPFLFAHIGILTLLFGAWITQRYGLDGTMRVSEGQTTSIVQLSEPLLTLIEGDSVKSIPVDWQPPEVSFSPISLKGKYGIPYDLHIQKYITHADANFDFLPKPPETKIASLHSKPALKITLIGGPMRIKQDFWLWTGDSSTQAYQAGPAWLELDDPSDHSLSPIDPKSIPPGGPRLNFTVEKNGILAWKSISSSKEVTQGKVSMTDLKGKTIDPHWRGVSIKLADFIPDAWVDTHYTPSRIQHGKMAPSSAIQVTAGEGSDQASVWLGIGSRAMLRATGHNIEIAYDYRQVMLPFSVRLDHFTVAHDPGTMNPAAFSSKVTVFGKDPKGEPHLISMNEPLEYRGITLYQASYEDAKPRPVTSIFSVNRDPGRLLKYIGSLLIVFGSMWLFALKYRRNKKAPQRKSQPPVTSLTEKEVRI